MYRGRKQDPDYYEWLVAYEAGEAKGYERTCQACGERFPARTARARFCSRTCYQWAVRAWVCPIDDVLYHQPGPPTTEFKKYCSPRCKAAARNLRNRGEGHDPYPKRNRVRRCKPRKTSLMEGATTKPRLETASGRVRRVITFCL